MRQVLRSPTPLKTERRNKALTKVFLVLAIVAMLFVGLGFLSRIPKLVINTINVTGLKVLDESLVKEKTTNYLAGKVAFVYSRGNIFLYSKNKLSAYIKSEFPRIYSVNKIDRKSRSLYISLEERQAAYIWCGQTPPAYMDRFAKGSCYFLDQTGFIFDKSPYFTPGVYLTFYGGIKSDAEPIGQTLAIKNSISEFSQLAHDLDNASLRTNSVYIKDSHQQELLLSLLTDTGEYAKILFNEDTPLSDVSNKVRSAIVEESFADEFKANAGKLQYIDTRFGNKVFYKFQK